jgi:Family of unknown function (DUF6476)
LFVDHRHLNLAMIRHAMLGRAMTTQKSRSGDDEDPPSLLADVKLSDPQVRALRVAVIVMGGLLVLGLVALIGRIIYLVARPSGQISGQAATIAPEVQATLPAGAHIRAIALQGDRLAIHYDAPAGSGIAIIDLASGRTASRILLMPEVPKP